MPVFRAKLNISQADLADRIGVTRQSISAFESKQTKMTWSVFLALLMVFIANEEANRLINAMEVYPKELEVFLKFRKIEDLLQ